MEHIKAYRATDDDLSTIRQKLATLRRKIRTLADALVENADAELATRVLSTFRVKIDKSDQGNGISTVATASQDVNGGVYNGCFDTAIGSI